MRAIGLILALCMFASALCAQEKKPWQIDRLCGKLEHVQQIPDRKNANNFSEKRKTLRDIPVSLYERSENELCCSSLGATETVRTGKRGGFHFKTAKAGNYWLSANWNGKEYKLAISFKPDKKSTTMCFQQGIGLDDEGNADWWVTITVD